MNKKNPFFYFNYDCPVVESCDSLCMIVKIVCFYEIFNLAIQLNKKGLIVPWLWLLHAYIFWCVDLSACMWMTSVCRDVEMLDHLSFLAQPEPGGGGELPCCWSDRSDPAEQIPRIWRIVFLIKCAVKLSWSQQ